MCISIFVYMFTTCPHTCTCAGIGWTDGKKRIEGPVALVRWLRRGKDCRSFCRHRCAFACARISVDARRNACVRVYILADAQIQVQTRMYVCRSAHRCMYVCASRHVHKCANTEHTRMCTHPELCVQVYMVHYMCACTTLRCKHVFHTYINNIYG